MVAGDIVNTASRIQSLADPGQVLVGEPTRRATEPTIVYEDAGDARAEGQDRPAPAVAGGARRVGRARLAQVGGPGGAVRRPRPRAAPDQGPVPRLGRRAPRPSRLGDRHRRDRQVAAGVGVLQVLRRPRPGHLLAPRPLPLLRRGRDLLGAGRHGADALPDQRGRAVRRGAREARGGARRAHPRRGRARVRRAARRPPDRARGGERVRAARTCSPPGATFFERLADVYPTMLVFEDMQWADASLLDFIEYLLDWSRQSPLFVVTAARPELLDRRATWGAGKRNFTSIYLEPLSERSMRALLEGLVPGLPDTLRGQILARAEGVPLYAMETVRMLLDRGHLVREGSVYRPAGPIEALEVPETLHALIAARLDGLSDEERRVVQDGAVLGKTFTREAVEALSGIDAGHGRVGDGGTRAQGGAVDPGRSALAGARPVRLPAGSDAAGRLRDALAARPPRPPSGGGRRTSSGRWPTTTRSSRCWRRTTSTPTRPRPMWTVPRPSGAGPASCSCARENGPSRWARRPRHSATTPSAAEPQRDAA